MTTTNNTPKSEITPFPSDWFNQFWQSFTPQSAQTTSMPMSGFGMNASSMLGSSFQPTLDPKELEKRIADLKAVEQWLTMNLNMLRGTIQSLEVQTATLAAVQSFSQSMQEMMSQSITSPSNTDKHDQQTTQAATAKQPKDNEQIETKTSLANDMTTIGSAWWHLMQQQLQQMVNNNSVNTLDPALSSQEKLKEKASPAVKNNRQKNNKHQAEDK